MADIALRLIWYRLTETYISSAESWAGLVNTYQQLSWDRVDVLDMLFLGWLVAAFAVIAIVNLFVRLFFRKHGVGVVGTVRAAGIGHLGAGETVQWVNTALAWLSERQQTLWLADCWLKALSEEAKKHAPRDVQIRFERGADVVSQSASVQLASVSTDISDPDLLTLHARVAASDVSLVVSMITSTATNLRTISCDVKLNKLHGCLQVEWHVSAEEVHARFISPPDLNLQIIPTDYGSLDQSTVESIVRNTISGCAVNLRWPTGGGFLKHPSTVTANHLSTQTSMSEDNIEQESVTLSDAVDSAVKQQHHEPLEMVDSLVTAVKQSPLGRSAGRASARGSQGRRLLVKMIKANGLMSRELAGSCDPYCTVTADVPPQQHTTSVVKNTINPFFDEHFIFHINNSTKQLKFEVFDRKKEKGSDDFLGRAAVAVEDLHRTPSSRQIIPLTGCPAAVTATSGSVTVEFLLMDATSESTHLESSEMLAGPYRYIETNRSLMPGGTLITTTTTTTDRFRDQLTHSSYNGSPVLVGKSSTTSSSHFSQSSQPSSVDMNYGLERPNGSGDITQLALHELSNQQRNPQAKTTTITVSGRQKDQVVPLIKTVQAPSGSDAAPLNTTSAELHEPKKKKVPTATLR